MAGRGGGAHPSNGLYRYTGRGAHPSNGLYREAPPKWGTFLRPQVLTVYERVGISLIEVYERGSVISVCKRPKRAKRCLLRL